MICSHTNTVTSQWNNDDWIKTLRKTKVFMCSFSLTSFYLFLLGSRVPSISQLYPCLSFASVAFHPPICAYIPVFMYAICTFFVAHNKICFTDRWNCFVFVCMCTIMRQLINSFTSEYHICRRSRVSDSSIQRKF